MHEDINRAAADAGLDPTKVFALAQYLASTEQNRRMEGMVTYPKLSGTKERRKAERQNKKRGRQATRKKR